MSRNLWVISDHHLNHGNILKFSNTNGEPTRPEFDSVEEMNEAMIERHNAVVKPGDKVYFLGDVGFNRTSLEHQLPRFNGNLRLILGNHDCYKMDFYMKFFSKILVSWRGLRRDVIFSHYPLLMGDDPANKLKANIHGHIHRSYVMDRKHRNIRDKRYYNVSVEVIDYTPKHIEDVFADLRKDKIIE